jgi:hypothetical protein
VPPFHVQPGTHFNKTQWYALLAIFASMFALTAVSLGYANYVANESSRKWCELVVTLDDTYTQTPPSTPSGRKVAQEIHNLRNSLKCKEIKT